MKLTLAVFGKARSGFVESEVERYTKRLRHSAHQLQIVELRESRRSDKLRALSEEAEEFEKRFPKKDFVRVLLAEEGKLMTSVSLAHFLGAQNKPLVLLIGSAYGLDASLKRTADLLLSLSPLTLTHDHARVITAEQLYRAATILAGHPYHHE